MFPLDLLQQELVSLLAPDTAAFLTVFGPLVQHWQQEAASSLLLSLSKLIDTKTSSRSCPVAWSHLTTGLLTLAGGAEVVSLSFLGLFLFPALLLEKDPAMVDQFLKWGTR